MSQFDKNSTYTMSLSVSEVPEWVFQYRNIWNEVIRQLLLKLTTDPIKGEGKYLHGQLEVWKEDIRTIFRGQDDPYNMYWNAKVKD